MLLAGAAAARVLRSRPAALRHSVWSLVLAATLALPLLSATLADHRIELRVPGLEPRSVSPVVAGAPQPPASGRVPDRNRVLRSLILPDPLAGPPLASRGLLGVWLLGASILLGRAVRGRAGLRRLARQALPVTGKDVLELLADCARAVGCRRRVRLLADARVPTPVAFGILRPVIVLPAGWEAWPPSRRSAVLLHELGHVARSDAASQLLAEVVRAIHWFDPLAWYAARQLAREREQACDDAVLRAGVGARDYAGHILEAAREMLARPALAEALPIAPRTELESRLLAILDPAAPRDHTRWTQRLRLAGVAAGCAVALACLDLVPEARASRPPNPPPAAASREPGGSFDDPLSELLPVTAGAVEPSGAALRNDAERAAFHRLQAAAAHVKTWEGDLVRERAEWALRQVRNGEVVSPLLRALEDPDWRVQAYAAWSLGVAGDERATGPILPLLDHPVWRVRAQALYSLLDLDADLPPARVARLAADPAWQVRIGVVEYLARRSGPEARTGLRALADDPHAGTRMAAQGALTRREPGTD